MASAVLTVEGDGNKKISSISSSDCFFIEIMVSSHRVFRVSDRHLFMAGVVSRITFSEQYLECTEPAVLTVEADSNFPLFRISSAGCFSNAIMVSSHCVLNDCVFSFFNSTFKISLRSKTDSSVPLTLKYS